MTTDNETLLEWARAAAGGDRDAAERLLEALQDGVYRLSLRMLGHPEDAEDATQEILVIVLTRLGSFRGESALRTWAWRIAANHLLRVRKGRRETMSFEKQKELLEVGLDYAADPGDLDDEVLAQEVRLRCTEAMMLSLDRESRLAYLLSDVFELSGEEAALVLEIDPVAFRKRVSRARARLLEFLRARCGLQDSANPCRCSKQITGAKARGLLDPKSLLFADLPARPGSRRDLERYSSAVAEVARAAAIVRHPDYTAPSSMVERMRDLLECGNLELFRH